MNQHRATDRNRSMEISPPRPSTSPMVPSLAKRGYVEEEHVVRGTADLYGYDDTGATVRRDSGIPFVTRILVRRPSDPAAATGDVVIEPLHPSGDMASAWPRTGRTIVRDGWTWVGVTQDVAGLAATKASDPERYAELDIPHVGLGYDIVAQVASLLRGPQSPVDVGHLVMTGASYTGTFQRVFLADGFHARTTRPDGAPAVEGYLIQISSGSFGIGGYNPINPDQERVEVGDPRRTIGDHGVPVIELLGEGEAETHLGATRDDSDDPAGPYRLYEVPGACHMSGGEAGHAPLAPTVEEPSDFPMWALAGKALTNLRDWVVDATLPPRAERVRHLASQDDGPGGAAPESLPLERDDLGNAVGGVRTPWVDVPIARYFPHSTIQGGGQMAGPPGRPQINMGDIMGCMFRFDAERLRELYGTPGEYQKRFGESLDEAVAGGWIADADVERLTATAATIEF
jgi:hypothetical protein